MGKCSDYATGKLDLDLDDEVPRRALADCLDSGWTADEIAEELGLEGEGDVVRWCLYHDLPLPKAAAAAKAPQEIASQPAAQDLPQEAPKEAATVAQTQGARMPRASTRVALWEPAVWALRQAGLAVSEIKQIVPLSKTTIYRTLERYDPTGRPKNQRAWWADKLKAHERARQYTAHQVRRAYDHIGSYKATGRALGISDHYVKKILETL
jgi:hypothetical protein